MFPYVKLDQLFNNLWKIRYGLAFADFISRQCSPAINTQNIQNFLFFKCVLSSVAQIFASASPSAWNTPTLLPLPICCFSSIWPQQSLDLLQEAFLKLSTVHLVPADILPWHRVLQCLKHSFENARLSILYNEPNCKTYKGGILPSTTVSPLCP